MGITARTTARACLFAAASATVYFIPFLNVLSHNGDEGTLVLGAQRVVAGEVPFRDFFEVMGPGSFYWLALFFKIFGVTWLATRLSLLVTTAGIVTALWFISSRLLKRNAAGPIALYVAVSFHAWNAVSHHMGSNLFALCSFASILLWRDSGRTSLLFVAGSMAGVATWFMLPKGVLLCLSFAALVWLENRKRPTAIFPLVAGYVAVLAVGLLWFWRAGALTHLIYANVLWPLANYSGVNAVPYGMEFRQLYWSSFMAATAAIAPPAIARALSGFLSLPFVSAMALPSVLLVFAILLRRDAFHRATLPYWLSGTALWISEMHRKDIAHIAYGSPLWIVLAFYLCRFVRNPWPGRLAGTVTAAAVAVALLNPFSALVAGHRLTTRRGVLKNAFPRDKIVEFLNARTAAGEAVFIYPYAPLYYFLGANRNPTRYSILMYGINTGAQFHDAVQSLESARVRYVVWDRAFVRWINNWFPAYRIPPAGEQIVEPYLLRHYTPIGGESDGYQFLERRSGD